MKKRTLAVVLSLVMALVLGVTAMAAPSKTVTGIVDDIEATDKDGNKVDIIVVPLPDEFKDEVADLKKPDTMKDVLGDEYDDDLTVMDAVDLEAIGDETLIKYPVKIKFDIAGVVPGTVLKVVQWNGEKWEVLKVKVGQGYVETTVDSLNPIAFIVDKDTLKTESPKTGDVTTAVAMMVVIAAAATMLLSKRQFAR